MEKEAINFWQFEPDPQCEQFSVLLQRPGLRVERIVSSGQTSGPYDQNEDEWVLLLEGQACLRLETSATSQVLELKRGESLFIPAHCQHEVLSCSDPALWLCVFVPEKSAPEAP